MNKKGPTHVGQPIFKNFELVNKDPPSTVKVLPLLFPQADILVPIPEIFKEKSAINATIPPVIPIPLPVVFKGVPEFKLNVEDDDEVDWCLAVGVDVGTDVGWLPLGLLLGQLLGINVGAVGRAVGVGL